MPSRGNRICGCGRSVPGGTVCACQRARKAAADARRPSARERGYDSEWERESKAFLAQPENRYCACGCGRRADCVDHKQPHKGDKTKFWDRGNWQPMAYGCNSRKAVREEGAFGNRRKGATS